MKAKASSFDKKTDMRDSLKTLAITADNKDEGQCLSALYKAFFLSVHQETGFQVTTPRGV